MTGAVIETLPHIAAPVAPVDVLSTLPVPVLVLDAHDRIVAANSAAEVFFNASQASLCDRGLDAGSPVRALIDEARRIDANFAAYDIELHCGGSRHRADILIAPLGEPTGWLSVTFQTRSVASLVDRHLVHQGAARSAVGAAAMLAHEIKNPLSGIRGAAQLIAQSADGEGRELTDLICSEVDRIRDLVDRMESFTDTRPLARRPENIHAVLGHVRRVAEQGFAKNVRFTERYDPSLPPVLGNRDALVQVFLNLVKNSAEALGEEGGEIILTTAYRQGLRVAMRGSERRVSVPLEICVVDGGPGAPAELENHLFEPFVTSKRSGTGLGLAAVAKIVGEHGGLVEYERQHDCSQTVLRVLLPMHRSRP